MRGGTPCWAGLAENVAALEREADRFERNCEQLQQYYQSLLTVTAVWVRVAGDRMCVGARAPCGASASARGRREKATLGLQRTCEQVHER